MRRADRFSKKTTYTCSAKRSSFLQCLSSWLKFLSGKQINSVYSVKPRGGKKRMKSYSQKMQIPDGAKKIKTWRSEQKKTSSHFHWWFRWIIGRILFKGYLSIVLIVTQTAFIIPVCRFFFVIIYVESWRVEKTTGVNPKSKFCPKKTKFPTQLFVNLN